MCGIVAYIGNKQAKQIVIKGLKRLEYRGYDSTGISIYNGSTLHTLKTKGKVNDLEALIAQHPEQKASLALGHTRWATHGVPNDSNAHPQTSNSGNLVVVHNGIIEKLCFFKERN